MRQSVKNAVKTIWLPIERNLPDGLSLRLLYYRRFRRLLHLKNPRSFTEKIQWLKLNYRDPIMHRLADKFAVRDFAAAKIGPEVLCPMYGIWDSPDDIPFHQLPETFALKVTSGSHANVFCRDRAAFDQEAAKAKLRQWLAKDYYAPSREWAYKGIEPRILAEKLLADGTGPSPADYKFYCFDGKPDFVEVSMGRHESRIEITRMTITLLDMDWQPAPFTYCGYPPRPDPIPKPANFAEMTVFAARLSEGFPFSRIDFYSIHGQTIFSEITFYPGAGFAPFQPPEWDKKIGDKIHLRPPAR